MQSIVATLLIAGCAYSISASAGNVQIQVLGRDGKPVPEAVVVLYPSAATAATAPSLLQASPTIEQERMRFVPALTVVAPGTTLRFTNQDRWDHHVRGTPVGPAATGGAGGNEGVELRVEGVDAIKEQRCQFDAGDLPGVECAAQLREGGVDHGFGMQGGGATRVAAMRIIR